MPYSCFFDSSSIRGWVVKELETVHIEEYLDLVDDLQYNYISHDGSGPEISDMITFFAGVLKYIGKCNR